MEESNILAAVNTNLPPCCLRIFDDRFVIVGTYDLDKPTGKRTGSLDVYDKDLVLLKSYSCYSAILDLKLSPFDNTLIITGHSTGNIIFWRILNSFDSNNVEVEQVSNLQVFDIATLITSMHFSPLDPTLVLVTATSGEAVSINIETGDIGFTSQNLKDLYSKIETKDYEVQGNTINATEIHPGYFSNQHSLECWTGEFGHLQPLQNVVFTGGDDATIMAHDLRSNDIIWSNNRIHEAGVVGIKCSTDTFRTSNNTSIITGSYDDNIRSLDLRMFGEDSIYPGINTPAGKIRSFNLEGGVWRFSENPNNVNTSKNELMVCCMYNGAKVISINASQVENDDEYFKQVAYLKKGHESMCYGGDWSKEFVVTCSFYDKSLQKWNPY